MMFSLIVYFFLAAPNADCPNQVCIKKLEAATIEQCREMGQKEGAKLHDQYGPGTAAYMCIAKDVKA